MSDEPNIVLAGFMGTGKTTIGRAVAEALGRTFIDLDSKIEERAGKPISALFAEDGEALFRRLEADAIREALAHRGLVLAVGGGAVLDPANRAALLAGGVVICLGASPEAIVARLAGQNGRPLLAGADREARVAALLAQRAAAYDALPNHLDTTHLTVAAAVERVLGIVDGLPGEGHRLVIHGPAGSGMLPYDVLIAEGLLPQAGARLLAAGLCPGRCAVVTNPTVAAHHLGTLRASLAGAGFEPVICMVPDGEAHKTLATVAGIYEALATAQLSRSEPVIALGGGVIGDMAGFVAATWLRGVPFVQIPTSLLAMVDASVGGKVAVDLPQGKNLVGAFKPPALVLIDPALLDTLPTGEYRSGMAEVLKTAIIGDPALFDALAAENPPPHVPMIADTVRVKAEIVARDPYEHGDRAWLNLGHTFGHALELLSSFTLRHGEGVALGAIAAAELSVSMGLCDPALPGRIRAATARLGLPLRHAFDPELALAAMGTDKKRRGRTLRFILPRRIGEVCITDAAPPELVMAALNTIRER
jgi:shikimate kinase/3-dehydroquinate synthase